MNFAHLLAAFIALLAVSDQLLIRRLKRAPEPRPRIQTYGAIMAGLWAATLWAAAVLRPQAIWNTALLPGDARWVPGIFVTAVTAIISVVALLVPVVIARKPAAAAAVARRLEKLAYLLPHNSRERCWWAILSITAGIGEECIFRSFLLWYLHAGVWRMNLLTAIAIACTVFALCHLYQGGVAALGTGLLALLFLIFFLGTGNLLLSIVLHTLADMRMLWLPQPKVMAAAGKW